MLPIIKLVTNPLKIGLVATAISATVGVHSSQAADIQVGMLNCTVAGGVGFILGSSKSIGCTFKKSSGATERYTGKIGKFGVDIGVTKKSYIAWAVFAPSAKVPSGALAGGYGGASVEVTAGGGVGANVLIGGFKKSFTLQPVSVQAQTGLNVAAGVGTLSLQAVR